MNTQELKVEARSERGKGPARRLRARGYVPAIFYGPHLKDPITLAIPSKEAQRLSRVGSNVLLTLRSEATVGVDGKTALLKDQISDPVSRELLHIDLVEIRMDEKIKVSVPIVLVGKAKGVGEGGILEQVAREIPVRCLPGDIPEKIEVDVSALDIGDSLHISDVTLPKNVSLADNVDYTLASVVPPEKEEVAATPVATEAGAVPTVGEQKAAEAAPGEKGEESKGKDAKAKDSKPKEEKGKEGKSK